MNSTIQVPATDGLHLILVRDGHYTTMCINPTLLKQMGSWSEKVMEEPEAGALRPVQPMVTIVYDNDPELGNTVDVLL